MKFTVLLVLLGLIVAVTADCKTNDKTYKKDETWQPEGTCSLNTCNGETFTGTTCPPLPPVLNKSDYNHFEKDPTKPYPQCCERFEKKTK